MRSSSTVVALTLDIKSLQSESSLQYLFLPLHEASVQSPSLHRDEVNYRFARPRFWCFRSACHHRCSPRSGQRQCRRIFRSGCCPSRKSLHQLSAALETNYPAELPVFCPGIHRRHRYQLLSGQRLQCCRQLWFYGYRALRRSICSHRPSWYTAWSNNVLPKLHCDASYQP